ncbi:cell division protein ZipA [Neisseriaceae bacterium PsAf]|nr:cell division protein ZipA [Neisseriaceae bacterium PsAf]
MQAETIFLGILVFCVVVVILVVLYGMYQENQYRKEVFKQFGHSNKDALLDDPVTQVRDGESETFNFSAAKSEEFDAKEEMAFNTSAEENRSVKNETFEDKMEDTVLTSSVDKTKKVQKSANLLRENSDYADLNTSTSPGFDAKEVKIKPSVQDSLALEGMETLEEIDEKRFSHAKDNPYTKESIVSRIEKIFPKKSKKTQSSISIRELEDLDLPWFNKCFDYMAYITLNEPKELHVLPRLSSKHRFKIAACNLDDQFQLAEPIPGVKYKAYVIGLQAISRSGLASKNDLSLFGKNVQDFSKSVNGDYHLTDVDSFYEIARPMDELCARVDQIIGLHLVSRDSINGIDLRAALERNGFTLSHDGAFYYANYEEELYKIVNMDETPFTPSLLTSNSFKGFSILFDITHVPPGHKNFDKFMGLAVKLANELGLDLVDDQLGELSTEWLRNIGDYVLERQKEMESVGIIPGEELAKRLFS